MMRCDEVYVMCDEVCIMCGEVCHDSTKLCSNWPTWCDGSFRFEPQAMCCAGEGVEHLRYHGVCTHACGAAE